MRWKADGAFAGVVVLEFVLVGLRGGRTHEVKGAVVLGRAEADQHPVLTESANPVADALLRLRRGSSDGPAQLLKRGALVIAQCCEVLVDGPGFGGHDLCWLEHQSLV